MVMPRKSDALAVLSFQPFNPAQNYDFQIDEYFPE
jgi:hypothetical protein